VAVDLTIVNTSVLGAFGQSFTLKRAGTGLSETITGILEPGLESEDLAPGEGSISARLFVDSSLLTPAPEKGDEVWTATTIYIVVGLIEDANKGLRLILRQDRMVTE
jgi:hypothetical protein